MHQNKHIPFYVNSIHHPQIAALLKCDYWSKGRGTRSKSIDDDFFISRIELNLNAEHANIGAIEVDEEDKTRNRDEAIVDTSI